MVNDRGFDSININANIKKWQVSHSNKLQQPYIAFALIHLWFSNECIRLKTALAVNQYIACKTCNNKRRMTHKYTHTCVLRIYCTKIIRRSNCDFCIPQQIEIYRSDRSLMHANGMTKHLKIVNNCQQQCTSRLVE